MATTIAKIRLGAADVQVLDQGLSTAVDLGASMGGSMFTYTQTPYDLEIDQALAPVSAWRTKEELVYETTLVQASAQLFTAAMSYPNSTVTTTAAGSLTSPAASVTNQGAAGAVTYTYSVVGVNHNGDAIPGTVGTTATGNATLTAVNFNRIAWPAIAGAKGYRLQRTVGGGSQGLIAGAVTAITSLTFDDTGIAATAYTPSVVAPATPNVDKTIIGNSVAEVVRTLDVTQPKNDGTLNHVIYHVNRCYSMDPLAIGLKRDKNTEYKVKLRALADPNSALQILQISEEY